MTEFIAISFTRLLNQVMNRRSDYLKTAAPGTKQPRFADEYPDMAMLECSMAHPAHPETKDARFMMQGIKPGNLYVPNQVMQNGQARSRLRKYEELIDIHIPEGLADVVFSGRRVPSIASIEDFVKYSQQGPPDRNDPSFVESFPLLLKVYEVVDPTIQRELYGQDIRIPNGMLLLRASTDKPLRIVPDEMCGEEQAADFQEMILDVKRHGFLLPHLLIEESFFWGRWRLFQIWQKHPAEFNPQIKRADGGVTIVINKEGMAEMFHDIPKMHWEDKPHWKPMTMLRYALDCIDPLWQSNQSAKWRAVNFLMDFLLYGFGYQGSPHLPLNFKDPTVHGRILEVLNSWRPFYVFPFPYFGQLLYELSDDMVQFPEPTSIKESKRFLKKTIPPRNFEKPWVKSIELEEDPRRDIFIDVDPAYGEMLMAASDYTYELHATTNELDPLVEKALLLHSYLYFPSFVQGIRSNHQSSVVSPHRYDVAAEYLTKLLEFKNLPVDYFAQTELSADVQTSPVVRRQWKVPEVAPTNRYRINRIVEAAIADDQPQPMTLTKDDRYRLHPIDETPVQPPVLATRKIKMRRLDAGADKKPLSQGKGFAIKPKSDSKLLKPESDL